MKKLFKTISLIFFIITRILLMCFWNLIYQLECIPKILLPRFLFYYCVKGKVVVITGGGSGLGRRVAQMLAAKGATIVSWDIDESGNETTANLINDKGGVCYTYTVDVTFPDVVQEVSEQVLKNVGTVDILINNAGILGETESLQNTSDSSIRRLFSVNVLSLFWTTKAFLPKMIEEKSGHIVTISSICGNHSTHQSIEYSSSKHACMGFDEALRLQLMMNGHDNIAMTAICPPIISTPLTDQHIFRKYPAMNINKACQEIVDAILTKTQIHIFPIPARMGPVLKNIFPRKTSNLFYKYLIEGYEMWTE